ncbi:hypothetical protein [Streptomyces cinnamoneus]|uniref:hypothetical protein n=1 Tax=Streptomyces cinnamoneus TaxID=53446 RepID=UPI000CEDC2F7|nr:hypothetical protein [Streptomyces cinnamoneus]PPT14779.1 hypothetical protein CYQ11_19580 [Streptomyces cinnamoneus]
MLREFSNLAWPDTPYAADMRPFARKTRLLTGMSIQWADEGSAVVPIGAAAVFIPVHRTSAREITADTLHFGYRSVAMESSGDGADILAFVDSLLIQGRRKAEIVSWHSFADDLHALRPLLSKPHAGIEALGEAWADRTVRERGTALFIDTAGDDGTQLDSALASNALDFGPVLWSFRAPAVLQEVYEVLTIPTVSQEDLVWHTQHVGAAALMCALAVALIGGRQAERLTWQESLDLEQSLRLAAWDTMPLAFDPKPRQAS